MSSAVAGSCLPTFAAAPLQIPHIACPKHGEPQQFQTRPPLKIMVFELSARSGALKIMVFELQAASGSIKTIVFHARNLFLL